MTDTNNTDGAALLPVTPTQADHDAANAAMDAMEGALGNRRLVLARAFARHRISHSLPGGMLAVEKLLGFEIEGDCPICGGIEECPHSLDERIAASRPKGTFECPICGEDKPHGHPPHEVERSLRNATLRLQAFAAASEARSIGIPYADWASKAGYDSRDIQNALGVHCAANAFAADLRAILAALTPSALSGDAGEGSLRAAIAKIAPITVHMGEEYAEVFFADGQSHSTQAMTMNPQDWLDIQAAYEASHQGAGG